MAVSLLASILVFSQRGFRKRGASALSFRSYHSFALRSRFFQLSFLPRHIFPHLSPVPSARFHVQSDRRTEVERKILPARGVLYIRTVGRTRRSIGDLPSWNEPARRSRESSSFLIVPISLSLLGVAKKPYRNEAETKSKFGSDLGTATTARSPFKSWPVIIKFSFPFSLVYVRNIYIESLAHVSIGRKAIRRRTNVRASGRVC